MKKTLKKIFLANLLILSIGIALFCYVNSGSFVKKVVLPEVAKLLQTEIKCTHIRFSIFSGIDIDGLHVGKSKRPLFVASNFRFTHQFLPLLRGKLHIEQLVLENGRIHLIEDENGEINLPSGTDISGEKSLLFLPFFDVSNVEIDSAVVQNFSYKHQRESERNELEWLMELSRLNFNLESFLLTKPFEISGNGNLKFQAPGNEQSLQGLLSFSVNGFIEKNASLREINLSCQFNEISGNLRDLSFAGRALQWDLNLQRNENRYQIKHCHFSELLNHKIESFLLVTGGLSFVPLRMDLDLVAKTEKSDFIHFISALFGDYDFGKSSFHFKSKITHDHKHSLTSMDGELSIKNYTITSVARKIPKLPPLDISLAHHLSWNSSENVIHLQKFDLKIQEEEQQVVGLTLRKPLAMDLKHPKHFNSETTEVTLSVKNFNTLYSKPFIPEKLKFEILEGEWNQTLSATIIEAGKLIEIEGLLSIDDVSANLMDNELDGIDLETSFQLLLKESMSTVEVNKMQVKTQIANELASTFNVTGNYSVAKGQGTFWVDKLQICPSFHDAISGFLPGHFLLENFNCDGNLKIDYHGRKGIGLTGSVSSDHLQIAFDPKMQPLSLSPTWAVDLEYIFEGPIKIQRNVINFHSDQEYIGSLTLSGKLDYLESSGVIQANGNIARILKFIPMVSINTTTEGEFSGKVELKFRDVENELFCKSLVTISNITSQTTSLSESVSDKFDLETNMEIIHKNGKQTKLKKAFFQVSREGAPLLKTDLFGTFFPKQSEKRSELTIKSESPTKTGPLLRLLSVLNSQKQVLQQSADAGSYTQNPEMKKALTPNLDNKDRYSEIENTISQEKKHSGFSPKLIEICPNIQVNLEFPEIIYDQINVNNLLASVLVKNNQVIVAPLTCLVNEGNLDFEFILDLQDPEGPSYKGKFDLENLEILPLLASMKSENSLEIEGELRKFSTEFSGKNMGSPDWRNQLQATASGKMEKVALATWLKEFKSIWNFLGLEHSKFNFDTVESNLILQDGHITFNSFEATGPTLKIVPQGKLEFGGKWRPNLSLVIGFGENLKDTLKQRNFKVSKGEDDYYYTEPLPFQINSWKKSDLIKSWLPAFSASLWDLDPEVEALIFSLKNVEKILLREKTLPKAISGILGVLPYADVINKQNNLECSPNQNQNK